MSIAPTHALRRRSWKTLRGSVSHGNRARGYLAEAMTNYLCLLGWSHPDGKDVFPLDEAVRLFDLARVARSPAVFDGERLSWMNAAYIRALDCDRLARLVRFLPPADEDLAALDAQGKLEEFVSSVQESAKALSDFAEHARIYTKSLGDTDETARTELRADTAGAAIAAARELLSGAGEFDEAGAKSILAELKDRTASQGLSGRRLFMPLRAALTGSTAGPELYHVLSILGRDEALRRLAEAAKQSQVP